MRTSAAAVGGTALALGGSSGASAQTAAQESCEGEFEKFEVGNGNFQVMNNQWTSGDSQQCIYKYEDGSYGWSFQSPPNGPNYPEVYIGERPWGEDTGVPEFKDAQRSDIDELTVEFDADVNVGGGEWDFALEWWLTNQTIPSGPIPDAPPFVTHEIMLVMNHNSQHSHGPIMTHGAIEDQFGNTIHHWADNVNGGVSHAQFHVFVLDQLTDSGEVDLRAIMDYLSDNYGIPSNRYFTGVEVGNEYWPGASGETTMNTFNVTVNGTTYQSGSGSSEPEPTPPAQPTGLSTSNVRTDGFDLDWSPVDGASEYNVYRDGGTEDTVSGTSYSFSGLSAGTEYEVGVEAVNGDVTSDRATTSVSTNEPPEPDVCADAEGGTAEVGGRTVCDVDGDGNYGDLNADGDVTHTDVQEFFSVQHRPSWKQPGMFDFNDNQVVGHGDVVALFEDVATGGI